MMMSFVAVVRCCRKTCDGPALSPPFIIRVDIAFSYRLDADLEQLLVEKRSVDQETDHAGQFTCDPSVKIDA